MEPGEFHLLCGPSGSGKSTVLKLLCGLIPNIIRAKVEGDVKVFGKEIHGLSRRKLAQLVGIVFQNPDDYFVATSVETELAFGLENLGLPRSTMLSVVPETLAKVGLPGFDKKPLTSLSGGQKQRLAIGCCLAMNAEVLLFDEPFVNLDPSGSLELITSLKDLKRKGITILLVTQRLFPELLDLVDRVTLLQSGKIVYQGSPKNFVEQAHTIASDPIYQAFLRMYGLAGKTSEQSRNDLVDGEAAVTFRNVSFTYSDASSPALDGVTCDFHKGEIAVVMGANGAGKSTLVRHVNGILRPQNGQVTTCGIDTRESSVATLARHVGFMFQNPLHTIFSDTVRREMSFTAQLFGIPDAVTKRKVNEIAAHFDISNVLDTSPFVLSAGEQQRVAIASTAVIEPKVLILDEPTHGLDGRNLYRLETILLELSSKGHSVIIVTHDVDLAYRIANRVILLKEGKVIANGSAHEVLCNEKLVEEAALILPTQIRVDKLGLRQEKPNCMESNG